MVMGLGYVVVFLSRDVISVASDELKRMAITDIRQQLTFGIEHILL